MHNNFPRAASPDSWRVAMQRPGPSYALPGQATSAPPLGQIGWVRFQSATRAKLGQISSVELGHSQPGHRRSASRQMSVARDAICLCLFVDAQNQSCGAQEAGCKGASGLTVRKRKAVIRTGPLRGNVTRHREPKPLLTESRNDPHWCTPPNVPARDHVDGRSPGSRVASPTA